MKIEEARKIANKYLVKKMNNLNEIEEKIRKEGDYEKGKGFGMPYILWRNKDFGHWCGYVGVPKNSRLDGKRYYYYTESENGLSKLEQAINDISIHGGLTFAGRDFEKFKDDFWYFGFDCGHFGDLEPYMVEKYPTLASGTYKDKAFVMTEIQCLAEQLKEILKLEDEKR